MSTATAESTVISTTAVSKDFETSEIVIISIFSVFGFLFFCAFLWAIIKRKPSWTIISITMVITVGSIGAISYFLYEDSIKNELAYVLIATMVSISALSIAMGNLYRRKLSSSVSNQKTEMKSRKTKSKYWEADSGSDSDGPNSTSDRSKCYRSDLSNRSSGVSQ